MPFLCEILWQDEGEDSETESDNEEDEKISRNWSIYKSNPELRKSKVIQLVSLGWIKFTPFLIYPSQIISSLWRNCFFVTGQT